MDSFEEKVEFLEKRKKGAVLLPFFRPIFVTHAGFKPTTF